MVLHFTGEVYEVDLLEGNIIWQTSLNTSESEVFWSTPAFSDDGFIILLTGAGKTVAIDTITKKTKWIVDLQERKGMYILL